MPYNPQVTDQRANIILQTGQQLTGDVHEALMKFEQDRKQRDQNDGLLQALHQQDPNAIDPDILAKWNTISPDKQAAYLGQTVAGMHDQAQQQSRAAAAANSNALAAFHQVQTQKAQLDLNNALNPPPPFQPTTTTVPGTDGAAPVQLVQTAPGHWITTSSTGKHVELKPDEVQAYQAAGYIPLRTSQDSFTAVKDPAKVPTTPAGAAAKSDTFAQFAKDVTAAQTMLPTLNEKQAAALGDKFVERLKTLTQKPVPVAAAGSEPMISVVSPSGAPGYVPQSKLQDALNNGFTQK